MPREQLDEQAAFEFVEPEQLQDRLNDLAHSSLSRCPRPPSRAVG